MHTNWLSSSSLPALEQATIFAEKRHLLLAGNVAWWDQPESFEQRLGQLGLRIDRLKMKQLVHLVHAIVGFPRHLSQHVGGFVISRCPISTLVPVENAAMPERTVIQWDKDDLDELGILKVDVLALGMLTALHRCFDLVRQHHHRAQQADPLGARGQPCIARNLPGTAKRLGDLRPARTISVIAR